MTYEESVLNAKNVCLEKGKYSKEYSEAVKEMNRIWQKKHNRVINLICKLIWKLQRKNS